MAKKAARAWWQVARTWLLRALAAWLLITFAVVLIFRFVNPPTSAFMVERRLEAAEKNEKGFSLRHQWVPLERISRDLQLAVVAAEDQKFPTHSGFDVAAIEDALEDRLGGKSSRGASTLTQQVAKNLFLWPGRSFVRKGIEAYFTALLELLWPKRRILEVHLNIAELGNGIYGVEVASRVYFGKPASLVTAQEAALLATVLPNPKARRVNAPTPAMLQRADWITDQARRLGPDHLAGL